jgi:hypothetical protein
VPFCRRSPVGAFWGGSGAHALFGEEKRTEVAARGALAAFWWWEGQAGGARGRRRHDVH